jgi:hypothetical protein
VSSRRGWNGRRIELGVLVMAGLRQLGEHAPVTGRRTRRGHLARRQTVLGRWTRAEWTRTPQRMTTPLEAVPATGQHTAVAAGLDSDRGALGRR